MLTIRYDLAGLSPARPGVRVLDLGAGAGRHSFEALRRGATVVSADLDDAALKDVKVMGDGMLAEGHAPASGSLSCTVADALSLPFASGSFDVVIVSEVLEHIPADRAAMAEIARVVKSDGVVAVSVPRWGPEFICWGLSREYHSNTGGHVRIYRRGQLLRRLQGAGLRSFDSHHAHALHSPYWWLKCLFGVRDEEARVPSAYHRFLVWDIKKGRRWVRLLEAALNPVLGKSVVVYLRPEATG